MTDGTGTGTGTGDNETGIDEVEATRAWRVALDDFERRLEQFESVLERRDGRAVTGTWPAGPARHLPLPDELSGRARSLLERADDVERRLVSAREALRLPPAGQRRRTTARPNFSTDL
ncbi:MAG: hypothetical protein ACFCVK_03245 [Acidimicrobiales bacterium]